MARGCSAETAQPLRLNTHITFFFFFLNSVIQKKIVTYISSHIIINIYNQIIQLKLPHVVYINVLNHCLLFRFFLNPL